MPSSWTWTTQRSRTNVSLSFKVRGEFIARPAFVLVVSGGKRVDDDRHPAFGPTASGAENPRQFLPGASFHLRIAHGRLAPSFLRRAAGRATGVSAAFGGNFRNVPSVQVRSEHGGAESRLD